MTELVICEKPSAAKKVATALSDGKLKKRSNKKVPYYELKHDGKDMLVGCAVGHLYGLAETKKSGWTYPVFDIDWKPSHQVNKGSGYIKNYITTLKKLTKKADKFTVACDYDVEGELIGLNALRFACGQKDANRMKFSTLTKSDLREAYEKKSKTIDWGQAEAGETRHKLDWFYGINLSRALTAAVKAADSFKIMSIGRVQGPALKLVVEKEREIQKFEPVPYWQLQLLGKTEKGDMEAWHEKDKFWEKDVAEKTFKKVKDEKQAEISSVKKRKYKQNPPYPFDLTKLQTEAYRHLGIPPKQTLAVAQKLYIAGLISYPRTSSQRLNPKIGYKNIISEIKKQGKYSDLCGKLLSGKKLKPNNGKKKDPAHPAIYPTGEKPKKLKGKQGRVYDLIVRRFLATFGEPATRQKIDMSLSVKDEEFVAEGKRTVEPGWHIYYKPYVKYKETELPDVKKGDSIKISEINKLEKETKPPKRYTQSSIIKELERRNLGTKATRANIVDTLFQRGYASGKRIRATKLGIETVDTLEKYSPEILDEKLTRHFEEDMEKIRQEKEDEESVLKEAKKVLKGILKNFKKKEEAIGKELLEAVKETREKERTVGKCKECDGGKLKIIKSKKTKKQFVACDNYPDCKTTFPLPQNALVKPSGKECKECGYPKVTVIRKGKRPQQRCINPKCKSKKLEGKAKKKAKKLESGKTKKKCPECGSDLVVRKSFYGKFLGCSSYPKCKHTESLDDKKKGKKKYKKKGRSKKKKS